MMPRHFGLHTKEPVELVKIGVPILIEAVAVTLFIAAGFVWLIIAATPGPA